MARRSTRVVITIATLSLLIPLTQIAQGKRDSAPLKHWPSPLCWQPSRAEMAVATGKSDAFSTLSASAGIDATTPVGSLVFVGMTPCRIADTRDGSFPVGFGPPSLSGGATRTFAIQSASSLCPVPSTAQAYSFNITVVPPGATFPGSVNPAGALSYLTIWPTGVPQPVVSTLNSFLGTVVANAAIVPAGTGGNVNVFVSHGTDLIIDINGYYAPLSGITLAQGTSATPSLSFAGDPGTGIFSSTAGTLNIAAGGASAISVKNGGNVGIGTDTPKHRLSISGGPTWTSNGWAGAMSLSNGSAIGWESNAAGQRAGIGHSNGGFYFFRTTSDPGTIGSPSIFDMQINDSGNLIEPVSNFGLPKALVYLNTSGAIVRCYNGVSGLGGNCGFTSQKVGIGYYSVTFNFPITGRFIVATAETDAGFPTGTVNIHSPTGNTADFIILDPYTPVANFRDAPINIIVF